MQSAVDADALIDLIDAGRLQPRAHRVVRAIFAAISNPTADEGLVLSGVAEDEDGDQGRGRDRLLRLVWSRMEVLPLDQQGGLRLLVYLLHADQAVRGHEADYIVEWARQRGLSEEQIIHAFG